MNIERELIKLKEGVNLSILKTNKFKDLNFHFTFSFKANRKEILSISFLKIMLPESCEKYDSKKKMVNICDLLYAANVSLSGACDVNESCIDIHFNFVDPKYVPDIGIDDYLSFVEEIIYRPLFNETKFNEAKKIYTGLMLRNLDRPNKKAYRNSIKLLEQCADELKIFDIDMSDQLEKITLDDIKNTYQKIINDARVDIYLIGDINEKIIGHVKQLPFNKRENIVKKYNPQKFFELPDCEESMKCDSSNIIMSYHSLLNPYEFGIGKYLCAIALLGLSPTSLLFEEVREKKSLCYFVYPQELRSAALISIVSSISKENKDAFINEVKTQINNLKEGNFLDSKLIEAKNYLLGNVAEGYDEESFLYSYLYSRDIRDLNQSLQEYIDEIAGTNRRDVIEFFNSIEYVMTYFLKGV